MSPKSFNSDELKSRGQRIVCKIFEFSVEFVNSIKSEVDVLTEREKSQLALLKIQEVYVTEDKREGN